MTNRLMAKLVLFGFEGNVVGVRMYELEFEGAGESFVKGGGWNESTSTYHSYFHNCHKII